MSTASSDEYRSRLDRVQRDIEEFAELIAQFRSERTRPEAAVAPFPSAPPFGADRGVPIPEPAAPIPPFPR